MEAKQHKILTEDQKKILEIKTYLNQYRRNKNYILNLKKILKKKQENLQYFTELLRSISRVNCNGMPKGSLRGGIEEKIVQVEDLKNDIKELQERIIKQKEESKAIKGDVLSEIEKLDNIKYCEVLELYYIECLEIRDIADMINYTNRQTYNIYNEAIRALMNYQEEVEA